MYILKFFSGRELADIKFYLNVDESMLADIALYTNRGLKVVINFQDIE